MASASPASSLARRVSTLPRSGTTSRPGRSSCRSPPRRADDVPMRAPSGIASRAANGVGIALDVQPAQQSGKPQVGRVERAADDGNVSPGARDPRIECLPPAFEANGGRARRARPTRRRTVALGRALGGVSDASLERARCARPTSRRRDPRREQNGRGRHEVSRTTRTQTRDRSTGISCLQIFRDGWACRRCIALPGSRLVAGDPTIGGPVDRRSGRGVTFLARRLAPISFRAGGSGRIPLLTAGPARADTVHRLERQQAQAVCADRCADSSLGHASGVHLANIELSKIDADRRPTADSRDRAVDLGAAHAHRATVAPSTSTVTPAARSR